MHVHTTEASAHLQCSLKLYPQGKCFWARLVVALALRVGNAGPLPGFAAKLVVKLVVGSRPRFRVVRLHKLSELLDCPRRQMAAVIAVYWRALGCHVLSPCIRRRLDAPPAAPARHRDRGEQWRA